MASRGRKKWKSFLPVPPFGIIFCSFLQGTVSLKKYQHTVNTVLRHNFQEIFSEEDDNIYGNINKYRFVEVNILPNSLKSRHGACNPLFPHILTTVGSGEKISFCYHLSTDSVFSLEGILKK